MDPEDEEDGVRVTRPADARDPSSPPEVSRREAPRSAVYVDRDGDGLDDNTGDTPGRFAYLQRQAQRDRSGRSLSEQDAGIREAASAEGERARAAATEYWETGEGQRDIDAGRTPRYPRDPDRAAREAADAYYNSAAGTPGGGGGDEADTREPWLRELDAATGDIPLVGNLVGAAARNARTAEERRRAESMGLWGGLMGTAPSADDLSVEYGYDQFYEGPESAELSRAQADAGSIEAQREALRGLQEQSEGRFTDADRRRMAAAQMEIGQGMRAQREADAAALQARGLGGSGTEVASMIGAGQAGADALYQRDTAAQVEAQRRALQALQSAGSMASGMRGQSFEEDTTRRGAADDFTRWQTDARRENSRFNVGQGDRTRESRAGARQQSYENRERGVAGMTDQYSSDAQARSRERAEIRQGEQDTMGFLGELID